ncbi:MAG: outer rane lipoprotein LolB [Moraxellaceae bacterium]|nr:outer rane lipoprotein LolB [Moraxellaceae bacterium]
MPALLRSWRPAAALVATLLVSACATRPVTVWTNPALPEHWEAEGKAAVRTADRGTNIYFTWTQSGPAYQIVVRGPLGLGRAELHGQPGLVKLTADNLDKEVSASSLEELLEMTTRHQAPVSHALHWLKAEPATSTAEIVRNPEGKLLQIKEAGWTIDYLEWSQEAPNLPRRLSLKGPEGQATVVIGLWRLDIGPMTTTTAEGPSAPEPAL